MHGSFRTMRFVSKMAPPLKLVAGPGRTYSKIKQLTV